MGNNDQRAAKTRPGLGNVRRGSLRALGPSVQKVTKAFLGKRCLAEATLLAEWPSVIGAELARVCRPRRLSFPNRRERREGTLVLRVQAAEATRLAHLEPVLIDRVNMFFGYKAVARLHFEHARLPGQTPEGGRRPRELSGDETKAIERNVAQAVDDAELRDALSRLGRTIRAYTRE